MLSEKKLYSSRNPRIFQQHISKTDVQSKDNSNHQQSPALHSQFQAGCEGKEGEEEAHKAQSQGQHHIEDTAVMVVPPR